MACRSDVFLQYLLMPRDDLQQTRLNPTHTLHSVCENGLQGGPPHVGYSFWCQPSRMETDGLHHVVGPSACCYSGIGMHSTVRSTLSIFHVGDLVKCVLPNVIHSVLAALKVRPC